MLPTYFDVEARNPSRVVNINEKPLIEIGTPGCFDDSGVTLASIVDLGSTAYIYYTGWKRRRVVSFELSVGIVIWNKETDSFTRLSSGPILAQDRAHPLLVAGPFVIPEADRFKMWYCSGTDWKFPDGKPEPVYTVHYAESEDGISWHPRGNPVIEYRYDGEVISAPWVSRIGGKYQMWYSTRGYATKTEKNYTIGFAESDDGIHWQRLDDMAGISRSESGWDSEMVCYPAVFPYEDKTYMFYSGNGVGRDGIGYAIAENSGV